MTGGPRGLQAKTLGGPLCTTENDPQPPTRIGVLLLVPLSLSYSMPLLCPPVSLQLDPENIACLSAPLLERLLIQGQI